MVPGADSVLQDVETTEQYMDTDSCIFRKRIPLKIQA